MGIRNFRNFGILERLVALGYLELIEDVTISVATTSVTFSGFTATKEDSLVLVSDFNNVTSPGAGASIYCYVNNNQTATNYYRQQLFANDTTITSNRVNENKIGSVPAFEDSLIITNIKLTNDGYATFISSTNYGYDGTTIGLIDHACSSTFTATTITQLDITTNQSNAIGIGSRFSLYRRLN